MHAARSAVAKISHSTSHTSQRAGYGAIIMEAMKQGWSDERLDDLNHRVDDLSHRMEEGFRRVDTNIRGLQAEINGRFDSLRRTMIQTSAVMIAALIGLIATQL
jgi:hypothetical protein